MFKRWEFWHVKKKMYLCKLKKNSERNRGVSVESYEATSSR